MKESSTPGARSEVTKEANDVLRRVYDHNSSDFKLPFEPALEQTIIRLGIPKQLFRHFIDGLIMETHFRQPADEDELAGLSYHGGGVWGILVSSIFETEDRQHEIGRNIGEILWHVRCLRNFGDDLASEKIMAPLTWMETVELTREDMKTRGTLAVSRKISLLHQTYLACVEERVEKIKSHLEKLSLTPAIFTARFTLMFIGMQLAKIKLGRWDDPRSASELGWTDKLRLLKVMLIPAGYLGGNSKRFLNLESVSPEVTE